MLRPLLAVLAVGAAAFLMAPTVASVSQRVEAYNFQREMPWNLWKWTDEPEPPDVHPPDCDFRDWRLESNVTRSPPRIEKNQSFKLGGTVVVSDRGNVGLGDVKVDLYLNETKEAPGVHIGQAVTGGDGVFELEGRVPVDLGAQRYHIVAHANTKHVGCQRYNEHWSDPEVEVVAKTTTVLEAPDEVVLGRELVVRGRVFDEVGAPVRGQMVNVTIDGHVRKVVTDGSGEFVVNTTIDHVGVAEVLASFAGNDYYVASQAHAKVPIVPEDVRLDGVSDANPLALVRGKERVVSGQVVLPPGATPGELSFRSSLPLSTCGGCAPASGGTVRPDAGGNFTLSLTAPAGGAFGAFNLSFFAGGLGQEHRVQSVIRVPVTVELSARGDGFFAKSYHGEASAHDETGAPAPGALVVSGPDGLLNVSAQGSAYAFAAGAPCGRHALRAVYEGNDPYMPASRDAEVGVCGFLAYVPSWMLDVPIWVWPLALVGLLGAWWLVRRLIERYAPTISRGPALTLTLVEPQDAPDVVAPGERVRAVAYLEAPLAEGQRLRMGTHHEMQDVGVADDLSARFETAIPKLGDVAVRAEIVDAKGRILTRRTATVRVVRYAEEIERRYKAIRSESLGLDAEVVSPREFELWLRTASPDLDPTVVSRLVGLFEEADYSSREAGRAEFVAFLHAERGVKGVRSRAA